MDANGSDESGDFPHLYEEGTDNEDWYRPRDSNATERIMLNPISTGNHNTNKDLNLLDDSDQ